MMAKSNHSMNVSGSSSESPVSHRTLSADLSRIVPLWLFLVAATVVALWWMGRSGSRILAQLAYTSPMAWDLADVFRADGEKGWQTCQERVGAMRKPGQRLEAALGVLEGDEVLEKARIDLQRAYEFNPGLRDVPGMLSDLAFWGGYEAEAYAWRGESDTIQGDWDAALTQYEIAQRKSETPTAQIEEGRLEVLIRLNRWEDARMAAQRIEGAPFVTSRYYRHVATLARQDGNDNAEEKALRKALEINPTDLRALYELDAFLVRRGRFEDAYSMYEVATGHVTNVGEVWHRKALIAVQLDRTDDAVAAYKKAISVQPNAFVLHHELAQLYIQRGQEERAKPYMTRAFELNPGFFKKSKDTN